MDKKIIAATPTPARSMAYLSGKKFSHLGRKKERISKPTQRLAVEQDHPQQDTIFMRDLRGI